MSTAIESVRTNSQVYSYQATLAASEKVNWRIEDIIGGDKRLDFSKRFMPESLARVEPLDFLSAGEKRTLNQIRGNTYLCIFGVVEEFILPFLMDHARPLLSGDDYRIRALLQFAGEEAKHIHLFKRFREQFQAGFGVDCQVIGPADAIGKAILAHDPLAVALAILQIEWMTQQHYLEGVKDDQDLDPLFKSLLKHHWMEEAQHAKLDVLMVEALAENRSPKQIESAFEEYLEIGGFIADGLVAQTQFDLESFYRATDRTLTVSEREKFVQVQTQANRWTYLGSGMIHPNFRETLQRLQPELRERLDQIAPAFC
ncbi:MAG TPA: diiron oxygenase [Pyrinomonadaceae bacterium]|nr:diiron oxygenase [Pyrinomonadaceae bacterium]